MSDLQAARSAYAAESWQKAFDAFESADRDAALGARDLELRATAAYMVGRDDDYVAALERAHQLYLEAGEHPRAARCTWWIGHNLLFRGQVVLAKGWFRRGQRLLDYCGDCVEQGWLLAPVWLEQMQAGDMEAACETAAKAAEIGRRFGDLDLVWLARDDLARGLITRGAVAEGLQIVEEALVAATMGDLSPIACGILYCNTIAFCRDAYELRHVHEWTRALTTWCDRQPEMVTHNGLCLAYRAEMLQLTGKWDEALAVARRSAEQYTEGLLNQPSIGLAHYRQAEIHRLRGEFTEAEEGYLQATRHGFEPQPGLALLRLARGNTSAAVDTIRRSVTEMTEPMRRAGLLPAYVEIMLAAGNQDAARDAGSELERIASGRDNEVLDALARSVQAALSLADDAPSEALAPLRRAMETWLQLEATYEVARIRVDLGRACRAFGDEDAASVEHELARRAFAELGAVPDLTVLQPSDTADHGLTPRELEVLRLVAAGRTNKEIAAALVISEHTVARHVQSILRKLDVPSRTAASAFAYEHDLI